MAGRKRYAALVAMLVLVLAGCADEPKGASRPQSGQVTVAPGPDGVQLVTVDSSDDYRFVPATVHGVVGKYKFVLVNDAKSSVHALAFKTGTTAEIPYLNPGQTKAIDFTISNPGKYQFFCSFHEALNQKGWLIVT